MQYPFPLDHTQAHLPAGALYRLARACELPLASSFTSTYARDRAAQRYLAARQPRALARARLSHALQYAAGTIIGLALIALCGGF